MLRNNVKKHLKKVIFRILKEVQSYGTLMTCGRPLFLGDDCEIMRM